jgi:hypothetical protein
MGMRTFKLVRNEDQTGVSGTGVVAEGVVFSHGEVVLSWLTKHRSIGVYPTLDELINIHGHEGRTVVQFD